MRFEVVDITRHDKACPSVSAHCYGFVWAYVSEEGHYTPHNVAFSEVFRVCRDRSCPHPVHTADPRKAGVFEVVNPPKAWAGYVHLDQVQEVLW